MNTATNSYMILLFQLSSDNFVFPEGIPIKQVTHSTRGFSHRGSQAIKFLFNNFRYNSLFWAQLFGTQTYQSLSQEFYDV